MKILYVSMGQNQSKIELVFDSPTDILDGIEDFLADIPSQDENGNGVGVVDWNLEENGLTKAVGTSNTRDRIALRDAKRDEHKDYLALIEDDKIPSSEWFRQSYFQKGRVA